ncbi:basigin [Discoglossus pictus]
MMGLGLITLPAVLLVLCGREAAGSAPEISTSIEESTKGSLLLYCNLTDPNIVISGHKWIKGGKVLKEDTEASPIMSLNVTEGHDGSGQYTCEFQTSPVMSGLVNVTAPPHVSAYKKSEHGNEGDTGVLTCKSSSFPPVDAWAWYFVTETENMPLINGTERYIIKSSGNKTELRIEQLDIEKDQGNYMCNGTNLYGTESATIHLRVRSRLAALWPFLGIVVEVLILVTIIFIYEKRRKPDEVPEDDDGAAPLKSNAGSNHDNVRQRNSS